MVQPDLYIGIDPDVQASGCALWDKHTRQFTELRCYDLSALMDNLLQWHTNARIMVRLEAGWLAKGLNWHKGGLGSANAVGRNHEIGRQVEKFCIKHAVPYTLVKPQGYSAYSHQTFCQITGWKMAKKTNPETRVAAMLVFGF